MVATMAERATDAERERRCEQAAALLAAGHSGATVAGIIASDHGISRRQARDYVRAGHGLLREALGAGPDGDDLSAVVWQTIAALQTLAADGATPAAARVGAYRTVLAAVGAMRGAEIGAAHTLALRPRAKTIPRRRLRLGRRTLPPF